MGSSTESECLKSVIEMLDPDVKHAVRFLKNSCCSSSLRQTHKEVLESQKSGRKDGEEPTKNQGDPELL